MRPQFLAAVGHRMETISASGQTRGGLLLQMERDLREDMEPLKESGIKISLRIKRPPDCRCGRRIFFLVYHVFPAGKRQGAIPLPGQAPPLRRLPRHGIIVPLPAERLDMEETMKKLVVGILAHVDAGKTTLSEAMLYRRAVCAGWGGWTIRTRFWIPTPLSGSGASPSFPSRPCCPCPTPRLRCWTPRATWTFAANGADAASAGLRRLVISGTDGVQGHTRTLWRLLEQYGVPVILFVNKMDLAARTGQL